MAWFRYLKANQVVDNITRNENYSYPYAKKSLPKFTPLDDIAKNTWITIDLGNSPTARYFDENLEETLDHSSYLVVYESDDGGEVFNPVRCFIDENNFLYFKSFQDHPAGVQTFGYYSLYYHSPGIRYVKPVKNSAEPDDVSGWDFSQDFHVTTSTEALNYFAAAESEIDNLTYEVNLESTSLYNFSFVNANTDWERGGTTYPGARMYLSFSGPFFELYGSKGSDFGKFKYTITALASEGNPEASIIEQDVIVDCYSSVEQENVLLLSKDVDDLEFRDYVINIQVLSDRNINSSGSNFKVNRYLFNYNLYLTPGQEQLSDKIALTSTGFIRQ